MNLYEIEKALWNETESLWNKNLYFDELIFVDEHSVITNYYYPNLNAIA